MPEYVKRRGRPAPGSIPDVLDIFRNEIRFYREIAPHAGVRVPACYRSEDGADGTLLVLEDLSAWQPGADPVRAATLLSELHQRWSGRAVERWPWLRPVDAADDLVTDLYRETWPVLANRSDISRGVVGMARRLADEIDSSAQAIAGAGPLTLTHGDASTANMRTSADGEIALLDWEDVSAAPGILDLAWLLVSSVEPAQWDKVVATYGTDAGFADVLPAVAVQGLLSLSAHPDGSAEAAAWVTRLDCAAGYLR